MSRKKVNIKEIVVWDIFTFEYDDEECVYLGENYYRSLKKDKVYTDFRTDYEWLPNEPRYVFLIGKMTKE